MLYDIRTSEKAATTLETLTGVNRTIWLAEQYKNYGRIDYTYADDVRNIITKHGGHYPDLNDLEMVVTHITTSSEKCRQIRQHGIVDLVKAYEFANSELRQFLENYEINMVSALLATHNLFSRLASQTAEMKGYQYPKEAENYTKILLEKAK